jgi:hypothetical protein
MFTLNCQATINATSGPRCATRPTLTTSAQDKASPAATHGRRVAVISLSQPKTRLPMLAAMAPEKVMAASQRTSGPVPASSFTRTGRMMVRKGK